MTTATRYTGEWIDIDRNTDSFMPIEAAATAQDGFIVRQDYMPIIKRYVREETVFWQLIRKEKADALRHSSPSGLCRSGLSQSP
jgi:hypothetical protein